MAVRTKTSHNPLAEGGNADIEEFLEEFGVGWEFIAHVDPGDFDVEKSLHNQARFETLDQSRVESYTEAMKRGDKFPPVIGYGPRHKIVMADGNHRMVSTINAKTTLGVYLLAKETPGETITLIMHAANAKHGLPTSEEERVRAALYLIENGANAKTAAARLVLPLKLVTAASAKKTLDQRFHECGIAPLVVEKLPEAVKRRLGNISTDEGFTAAVDLAVRADMSSSEANQMAIAVNEVRSSARQVKVVEQWAEDYAERIAGSGGGTFTGRVRGPKARVNMALGAINALPDDLSEIADNWQGPEREEAIRKIRSSARRLNELAKTLSSS